VCPEGQLKDGCVGGLLPMGMFVGRGVATGGDSGDGVDYFIGDLVGVKVCFTGDFVGVEVEGVVKHSSSKEDAGTESCGGEIITSAQLVHI